jgi:hypothetical protein
LVPSTSEPESEELSVEWYVSAISIVAGLVSRVMPVVAMLGGALFLFGSLAQRRRERQR